MRAFGRLVVLMVLAVGLAACSSPDSEKPKPSASPTPAALPDPISIDDAPAVQLKSRQVRALSMSSPDALVSAFGRVWVKLDGGPVLSVDPSNGHVEKTDVTDVPNDRRCAGLGATTKAVWSCHQENELVRINPSTGEMTPFKVGVLSDPINLAGAGDSIWTIGDTGDRLVGVGDDGKVVARISLDMQCTEVASSGKTAQVWVACPNDHRVLDVDTARRKVVGSVGLTDPRALAVADDVFVGFADGTAQVDPKTLKVEAVYSTNAGLEGGLWASGDDAWVRQEGSPFLVHLDPQSHAVVERIETPKLSSGGSVVGLGGSVWATAANDGTLVNLRAR